MKGERIGIIGRGMFAAHIKQITKDFFLVLVITLVAMTSVVSATNWTAPIPDDHIEPLGFDVTDCPVEDSPHLAAKGLSIHGDPIMAIGSLLKAYSSESTIYVNPGEPIQDAIDALPHDGGIIELLPGVHEVNNTIVINRGNVTIQGTPDSEIRSHNSSKDIFIVNIPWEGHPALENFVFKGFKVTSSYTRGMCTVRAWNVTNITMEDISDLSYSSSFLVVNPTGMRTTARGEDIFIRNNTVYYSNIGVYFSKNIHVVNNTLKDSPSAWGLGIERNDNYVHVIGNHISNYGVNGNLALAPGNYFELRDNVLEGSQVGIHLEAGCNDIIISNNTITRAKIAGIRIKPQFGIANVTIINNRIYNNYAPGILATQFGYNFVGYNSNADIINNIIYNNADDGIQMTSEYVNLTIKNNIITNNSGYGINYMDTVNPTTISYNDVWNNTNGNYDGISPGTGDISTNPKFADPANWDFHLKSTAGRWNGSEWVEDTEDSPCIDAGDPNSTYSNEPEPNGGRINMGAYGNTGGASKSPPSPASISDLQNTTGQTWICWTWKNPIDSDFNYTMVFLDGNWKTNTSKSYYIAKGLDTNTSHEISTHTVDTNGNVNKTWVNQTAKTNLSADTTPPIIINVNITDITLSSASITWDTDDISDSLVRYGTSSENYMEYVIDEMPVRNHSILLTGLEQNTTYYYVVNSTNPDNLSDQSGEYDFTTVSGCFIATAAYGTSLHKNIDILRNFRDKILVQTPPGRTLVTTYYSTSPPIANALAKNDSLRSAVRLLLITPLVYFAEMILNSVGLIALAFLGLGAFFVGIRMRSLKVVLKAFGLGLLTVAVLTGMVFTLGWLAYTYPVCAVIAAYILPLIIPASIGVSFFITTRLHISPFRACGDMGQSPIIFTRK